ncbi:hypothetical protein AD945_03745 [Gluconobacter albidus]|uniref:Uncharacterized protein n=1 Tax=Gluconobacter albidus TaxID=318683 RepID=A0A149TLL4_9PROT|nr:hypothetical protein [Gluconobacter albidus]KXV49655.1 hypothetical protein AD945_03745 [Gluconobacter albidus]
MNTSQNNIRKYLWAIGDRIDRLPSPLKQIATGAYFCFFLVTALAVVVALAVFITVSFGFTLKLVGITAPLFVPPLDGTPLINLMTVGATYLLVLGSIIGLFFVIGSALSGETK